MKKPMATDWLYTMGLKYHSKQSTFKDTDSLCVNQMNIIKYSINYLNKSINAKL